MKSELEKSQVFHHIRDAIQADEIAKYFGCRIDFSKPTAVDMTDCCVLKDTKHTQYSAVRCSWLDFQEGAIELPGR